MMNGSKSLRVVALGLAALGLILPRSASAEPGGRIVIRDVRLHTNGALRGQVVTPQGQGVASQIVTLQEANRAVAIVKTDRNGYYAFREVRGGTYQIATNKSAAVYRAWAEGTAPPSAQNGALLVEDDGAVRGQYGPAVGFLANPWVISALIVTAIAIPVAVSNGDDLSSS